MIRPGWRTSGSTALFTFLNINGEHTLEPLRPGHRIRLWFRVLWFFDRFLRNNVFTQFGSIEKRPAFEKYWGGLSQREAYLRSPGVGG